MKNSIPEDKKMTYAEFADYLASDLEYEEAEFYRIASELGLDKSLDSSERDMFKALWCESEDVKFLLNSPGSTSEWHKTHHERHFLETKRALYSTAGWRSLPEETKRKAEELLFTPLVESPWWINAN